VVSSRTDNPAAPLAIETREIARPDQDRRDGRMGKEKIRERQMAEQLPADEHTFRT
jgi:hypothetical protein